MSIYSYEPPQKWVPTSALYISLFLHGAFLLYVVIQALFFTDPPPLPKKLFVQSITLKPLPQTKHVATPLQKIEQPAPPQPIPQEEKEIAYEEPEKEPPIKEPSPEKEPAASPPAPEEKKAPIPTPQKEQKKPSAPPSPKKTPPKQPTPKPTPQTKKSPNLQKKQITKKAAPPPEPTYDKKLVAQALEQLNRSKKAVSGRLSSSYKAQTSARVGSVGSLHSEAGISSSDPSETTSEYKETSPEACYIADLIRRLQLNIRLPEPGEIKLKLTLKRSGAISSVVVISCKKEKIKANLVEKLKAVHFSSFGQSFKNEPEHTFLLRLSNDLVWRCS